MLALTVAIGVTTLPTIALEPRPSEGDPVPRVVSADPTYGFAEGNPIKVGQRQGGPRAEEMYLSAIAGPDGETVKYKRLGSCCHFETPNGMAGLGGLLDKFEVKYRGIKKPVILYLNMYDYEQPLVPRGFSVSK